MIAGGSLRSEKTRWKSSTGPAAELLIWSRYVPERIVPEMTVRSYYNRLVFLDTY